VIETVSPGAEISAYLELVLNGCTRRYATTCNWTPSRAIRWRGRDGPTKFLDDYGGYSQADAYCVYDASFKPARGLTEVGCMMHMRRYFFKALDSDQERMGKVLHLIARLYGVEDRTGDLTSEQRLNLRQRLSVPNTARLRQYLLTIRDEMLPKSPVARAVRYSLKGSVIADRVSGQPPLP